MWLLGLRVSGSVGFRALGFIGFRVWGLGFRVWNLEGVMYRGFRRKRAGVLLVGILLSPIHIFGSHYLLTPP